MKLLHSCMRVAELLSQQLDGPLDWLDRLRLRIHLSMCSDCTQVDEQLKELRSLSGELFDRGSTDDRSSATPRP